MAKGRIVAEGTPSSLKSADRSQLRLQVMLAPGQETPPLPPWAAAPARVGNHLITTVAETEAAAGITWAAALIDAGVAEEYALGATTLEEPRTYGSHRTCRMTTR